MPFYRFILFVGLGLVLLTGCQPESQPISSNPSAEKPAPAAKVAEPESPAEQDGIEPTIRSVRSTAADEFEITYEWKLAKKLDHDWRVFVHFTDVDGQTKFQNDHDPEPVTSEWKTGKVEQGPFKVKIPAGFEGELQIRMGLYDREKPGEGSRGRRELDGNADGERRIIVGRLLIGDATVKLLPID